MPSYCRTVLLSCCIALLVFSGIGCSNHSSKADDVPAWQKQNLLTGPDVLVRLLRKRYFTSVVIEWPTGQVVLTDGQGKIIEQAPATKKVYLKMKQNKIAVAFKPGKKVMKKAKKYHAVWLKTMHGSVVNYKMTIPEIGLRREYEGSAFQVSVKYSRVAVVNKIPMELYIARVLPAEMDPDHFTLEALKAQAIVARTWALRNLRRHGRFKYNLCDGPHCQVYKGRKLVSKRSEKAVKMTLGEVLTINNKLADAFYHSTCGGNTVFVHEVWRGKEQAHLSRVEDRWKPGNRPYCAHSPYAKWTVLTSVKRVQRVLRRASIINKNEKLKDVRSYFVNRSGRVLKVSVTTDKREFIIKGGTFRSLLNSEFGKRKILSNLYTIRVKGSQFKILGRGLGHGVGLCQWGARGMAQHGFAYDSILNHYFKGTEMRSNYGVAVPVPASEIKTSGKSNSQTGKK